jgi:hypothetical protein
VLASSSTLAKRFEALCCLRPCWVLRGVGLARAAAPAPKLLPLRRWPKPSPVAVEPGCVCAGESWPEGAEALDEVGTAGGFDDMVPPVRAAAMTMAAGLCRARADAVGGGVTERNSGRRRKRSEKHDEQWRGLLHAAPRTGWSGRMESQQLAWR